MERKSNRMVQLTCFLAVSLMFLYGTHTLAGDHRYHPGDTANGHTAEYWWVAANSRLELRGEAMEDGTATASPTLARMPYWWESSPEEQNRPCHYGWDNPENSPGEPMTYWWHTPTEQGVSL